MSFAFVLALLTGFVSAGFISSLWPLLGGRNVSFGLLMSAGFLLPLEVLVVTFSIPLLLLKMGTRQITGGRFLMLGWSAVGAAVLSGFFQGVVVLSVMYQLG
jgi:hypothetical protein